MKNKGFIVTLTIVITLLCLYYLQFTFVARKISMDARKQATQEDGIVNLSKKQAYLDSIWSEPVYNFLGKSFTYKEIKETELSLGLDLQGGMHVTLEVSPEDIIKGLSGNPNNPTLVKALQEANRKLTTSQEPYVDLFYASIKEIDPNTNLVNYFLSAANRDRFTSDMTEVQVLQVIRGQVDEAIDRSFQILRARIDQFGTSSPNIQRIPGSGRIQIELPGVENQERVRKLLQGVAKLEFMEVVEYQELAEPFQAINDKLVEEEKLNRSVDLDTDSLTNTQESEDISELLQEGAETDTSSLAEEAAQDTTALDSLANTKVSEFITLMSYPYGVVNLKDTSKINKILRRLMSGDLKGYLPSNIKFLWGNKPEVNDNGEEVIYLYAVRTGRGGQAELTGEVITNATQSFDQKSRPAVSMQMNAIGSKKWERMTEQLTGRRIAIVLDDRVYSAPVVQNKIPGGRSEITGNFTTEEAKDLASVLKAGALPARTRIVEEAVVGPSLGREAIRQGLESILLGLVIVVVFMIIYYAKSGLVANVALVFNIFFILGILAQPGLAASLTLPGIAGIVLTIGMSIDANVLIFERIREELRLGKSMLRSIDLGYEKAFSSIIDANATTFLTAVILFAFGLGPVRGFATTLMIGIVCSFFTAVFITRVILSWMSKKGDKSKISFSFSFTGNLLANTNIDFLSKRKFLYLISSSIIVFGIALVIIEGGLNFGVDFTGGRSYIVAFDHPVIASDLKVGITESFEDASTEVKTYDSNNKVKVTTSYLVNDESTDADEKVEQTLIAGLEKETGLKYAREESQIDNAHFSILGSSKVGATIADDIKDSSSWAIFFSLVVIFIYILVRFKKWQYSAGAIVALIHDSLFVIAAFAIARLFGLAFEVDQIFIAAVLTIIGYSINDTVVVFDRIRENVAERPHENNIETFNMAINNTISRTLMTSFTTLIVVFILLVFGGEVLSGFSFALFVGIMVGTYSSIFIATPVVLDLSKSFKPKGDM